jgi:S1-C subfamily serine protease
VYDSSQNWKLFRHPVTLTEVSIVRTSSKLLLLLSSTAFFCLERMTVLSAQAEAGAPADLVRSLEQARMELFKKTVPSIVILEVELLQTVTDGESDSLDSGVVSKRGTRSELRAPVRSEGSGFIVKSQGVIITNLHVVSKARRITVRFYDGRRLEGRVIGVDERTDVAVVQVDAKDLPVLEFADSEAAGIGQFVYAIGVPFGQEWSFSSGMLSGKGRSRLLGPSSAVPLFEDYLQTDAVINPGHSGGPLLDSEGRVLGMNTLITRAERGLAFAVPSNVLAQTFNQLMEAGKVSRPWLGIRVETLGDTAALQERLAGARAGVVVLALEADGPALRTDLRPADVIQSVDGRAVTSALELQRELFNRKAGTPVALGVWRQGAKKTISIQTVEIPDVPRPVIESEKSSASLSGSQEKFGLTLRELKGRGVRVEGILEGSVAAANDLELQDVITEVENRPVRSAVECISAIRAAEGRSRAGVLMQVERQGRRTFVLWRSN